MNSVIDAVIVTYNPNIETLEECVASITGQVRKLWIIDNSSTEKSISNNLIEFYENIEVVTVGENKGIAFAQNIGIQNSLSNRSDYILLADQDSVFPKNYVDKMLSLFDMQSKVAAVSPLFHDTVGKNENEGFVVFSKLGFSRIFPKDGSHFISQTIASGLILNSALLENIGLMNTELFIDWVDYEWCWRAVHKGYKIVGNAEISIEHNLGDRAIQFAKKRINLREPIRHYYITRNACYLARKCSSISVWQRVILFGKSLMYIVGYSLLAVPRLKNLKMTLLGFYHGMIGRLGRLE